MIANRLNLALQDQHLAEVIAGYLQADGQSVSRQELLARHPDLADELVEFFAGEDQLDGLVKPLQPLLFALGSDRIDDELRLRDRPVADRMIGDYELLEEIARGGMGVVFRARQISLNRIVALKMILAGQFASRDDVERFRREAVAAANLDHPNIVPIYDVQDDGQQPYISMKLIEGGNLADFAPAFGKKVRTAVRLVATVARAIHHAHQRGLLHRDLKPANILLDEQGEPHITDFGLVKCVLKGEADANPGSGVLVGTPSYMAPEQAAGTQQLSTAADVYSLGVILYELLCGTKPFRAETPLALLLKAAHCDPVPPRRLNPKLDADMETICLRCLEKDPESRYGSALALAEDLEHWLRGEPIRARSTTSIERSIKWAKRKPTSAALLGVSVSAVIVISMLLAVGYVRTRESLSSLETEQQKTAAALHQERNARQKAQEALLENARLTTEALRLFNDVYTAKVVERLKAQGIDATHDYAENPTAIPLPQTLISELARQVTTHCHDKEIRIFSDFAFPWNAAEGTPRDTFEEEALTRLRQRSEEPFYRFEDYRGRPALRYATAIRVTPSGAAAYTTYSEVNRNWQAGDVGGVCEVILPVDAAVLQMARQE